MFQSESRPPISGFMCSPRFVLTVFESAVVPEFSDREKTKHNVIRIRKRRIPSKSVPSGTLAESYSDPTTPIATLYLRVVSDEGKNTFLAVCFYFFFLCKPITRRRRNGRDIKNHISPFSPSS